MPIYILRLTIIIRAIFHKVINIVQPNFPYPLFIFIQFGIASPPLSANKVIYSRPRVMLPTAASNATDGRE